MFTPTDGHRRRSWNSSPSRSYRLRAKSILTIFKLGLIASLLVLTVLWFLYEPHIELAFYNRYWIKQEIERIHPLSGCFDEGRVSTKYNVSEALYGKKTDVQAGVPLRMGMDCYD